MLSLNTHKEFTLSELQTPVGDYEIPSNAMAAYFASNLSTEECSGHVSKWI